MGMDVPSVKLLMVVVPFDAYDLKMQHKRLCERLRMATEDG